eukprot:TRINITY_DN17428_c0_g1_i1.p1 TRINITY_DN17428_c0_g1~~TRINITY_DN17428_c0_g1_i1.p1  ORF type:complete len:101 (+),score=26.51 TRINITY_DN17428_c0_g1_i1:451-753(+)
MGKTGIVIDQLDAQNTEYLLTKSLDLIKAREFVDLLISWIIAAIDRDIKTSLNVRSSMMEVLRELLEEEDEEYQLDELQVGEISRVYNVLQMSSASVRDY